MKKLILIDGNAILHRAYHALPPTLRTSKGELVNAVYGFASVLLKILLEERPDYICTAFDSKEATFRHKEYAEYKATRVKAPQELYDQLPRIKDLLDAMGVLYFAIPGYEADDLLGTMAQKASQENDLAVAIVTGDMDALQLVSEKVSVLSLVTGVSEVRRYSIPEVEARYGIPLNLVVDYKGLCGDNSDNIPGVRGIGPKTAVDLLKKYGSLEEIYKHLDGIASESVKTKLREGAANAELSKKLSKIDCAVPFDFVLEKCVVNAVTAMGARDFFKQMEFHRLEKKLDLYCNVQKEEAQPTLF